MSEYTGDNQGNSKNTKRQLVYTRWGQLKSERASWYSHWQEISRHLLPRSGRFFVQDRNRGYRRDQAIYDNSATRALRVLAAGMMSGMTSPARPWFRLSTSDPQLTKNPAVKAWLSQVTGIMLEIFNKSNTYRAFHSMYEELGAFGTGASIVTEDYRNIIHHFPLTAGEYCIAADWKGDVCTLYREFQKPVVSIVKEFGLENVSNTVKSLYDRGSLDQWVTLVHAIEPREDRDITRRDSKNMPWKSVYFEIGGEPDKFLRESGFNSFPCLAPRWAVVGGDIYGGSPGMDALGDIKQLQQEQLRKAQAIDYKVRPPLAVPMSVKNRDVDRLPGGITFVDTTSPNGGIKSMWEVSLDLNHLSLDIQQCSQRIQQAFYSDLFLMISDISNSRMTATEVAERKEEKMLMLGPVLERLQNEMLDPTIDVTFERMLKAGIVPPPPPELQGQDLNVEFVSILAQAQRAIQTNAIDRFVMNLGQIAQLKPDVLDKLDADKWAEEYSDMLGVDPSLIVPSKDVALIRQQRAKQQAAQQAAAMAQPMSHAATAAQKLSQTDPQKLQDVMGMFSGYTSGAA